MKHLYGIVAFEARAGYVISKHGYEFLMFEVETKVAVVFHIIDMTARWRFELSHVIVLFVILY